MPPAGRRHRSSTSASTSSANTVGALELQPLLQDIRDACSKDTIISNLQQTSQILHRVRQHLIDSPTQYRSKDAFRHLQGFQILLAFLKSLSGCYDSAKLSRPSTIEFFEVTKTLLGILSEALNQHPGNRRYFSTKVAGGGWKQLEQALTDTGIVGDTSGSFEARQDGEEQLFGALLAFALGEDSVLSLFGGIRRHLSNLSSTKQPGLSPSSDAPEGLVSKPSLEVDITASIQTKLDTALGESERFRNPELVPMILKFWLSLPRTHVHEDSIAPSLPVTVLLALHRLAILSEYNLLCLHSIDVLAILFPILFEGSIPQAECIALQRFTDALLAFGIPSIKDARYILRHASDSDAVAKTLLSALTRSRVPAHIQFDLSLHGYASVEIPSLGRTFPPTATNGGYTVATWLQVDKYDSKLHTTIFGAFDSTQKCFVLAYIEKGTRNLILQTSISSPKPSIRFKTVTFDAGRWYHIALVHRRPRTVVSSKVSLFVDGELVESLKCQYPSSPPSMSSANDVPSSKQNPVQAFLGTPQDLSSCLGRNLVRSKWSLASFHLFEEIVSDDLLAVYYRLGPRYSGNFQDCLGSFQTYEASASLNLRNELLHPGKEDRSELVSAIRSKASALLPESRILLNISPMSVLDDNDRNHIDESQLVKSLSKQAAVNLQRFTRSGSNAVAINCAIPSINEALIHAHGVAVLTGDPIVVVPSSLDDASWRVGGCAAVGLKLVEAAKTREAVVRAVRILFETVKDSWRNSEAMERENAFGVLATLLSSKMRAGPLVTSKQAGDFTPIEGGAEEINKLSFELLEILLGFVGYRHATPEESMIVNPLAYRILLVDFDMWRGTNIATQRLYYKQFVDFSVTSKYDQFNAKRLNRMRIVKRLLDSLKSEAISAEIFPDFMLAFRSLVKCNTSAEVLRSLALFVTYALHKPAYVASNSSSSNLSQIKRRPTASPRSTPTPRLSVSAAVTQHGVSLDLSRVQLAVKVLEMYTQLLCDDADTAIIKKFARTVTNKWLLYLLGEDNAHVVVFGAKILARLLTVHGSSYVSKFGDKSGGFIIMKERLKRWWSLPSIWPILFAVMFDFDVCDFDFDRPFELYSLLQTFLQSEDVQVVYPDIVPVITAMLGSGLKAMASGTDDEPSMPGFGNGGLSRKASSKTLNSSHSRRRSMSLNTELMGLSFSSQNVADQGATLRTVSQFLVEIHTKSKSFQQYAVSSTYVQELLFALFPIIVSSDSVSAETELNSHDSALTFNGGDVLFRPMSRTGTQAPPIVRTTTIESVPSSPNAQKPRPLRRGSSFVLITSDPAKHSPSPARLNPVMSPKRTSSSLMKIGTSAVEGLLEIILAVFVDQVLVRKDFGGFGLFFKVPPGFQVHQVYFESFILLNTLNQLGNTVQLDQKLLWEPRVLTNLSRFTAHLSEAVFEGWFLNGADPLLSFAGDILEYLQRPEVAKIKSVRLCTQTIAMIRVTFMRLLLLRLSELDESDDDGSAAISFLDKMMYWQTIILSADGREDEFLRLVCYHLYVRLVDSRTNVRSTAANIWRIFLVQKPTETSAMLNQAMSVDQQQLSSGFKKLMELDNDTFIYWVDDHREDLDAFFFGALARHWEDFVARENQKTQETAKSRLVKRKEKLKQWVMEHMSREDTIRRHEVASHHWMVNIFASEHLKHQRAMQDQQDNVNLNVGTFRRLDRQIRSPCGLWRDTTAQKWRLDQTEGRNRMRIRILPDSSAHEHDYQPKRKRTESAVIDRNGDKLKVDTFVDDITPSDTVVSSPSGVVSSAFKQGESVMESANRDDPAADAADAGEDFELVEDPRENGESYEDKNRKVMRSLQRGDQVQNVYNVSRIVGLEAIEGLLIIGKESLYLLDTFFQRSDGEIVNVWQAPSDERDPYLQMISGREPSPRPPLSARTEHETRDWTWRDVISVSKRRFLFRDVAIEVFFTDGRSYLLTTISPSLRDELHQKLIAKAPHVLGNSASPHPEDSWRLDTLKSPDDVPQTLGSKFANVFTTTSTNPATRKWAKGEISNFHYLMLVNTMAGRTFNDLTQYPVFPWILADYSSPELDLDNPRTFRDLSKPMGCQTPERQADFRERYQSFAEMGDHNAPPFHYGTHYSSAMIVTSYLIRLQPFVQSYLLLQGGHFDHADRMFYSIEKAWMSASRDNMTDVRELTPEFFCLPEFLKNTNGYDFGVRQGSGGSIDNVVLPAWANGDPRIFVAKHREALESPHVSRQLHHWIDLVFGSKQRGEAAIEATNVFHHLSYRGAKDLDNIEDPVERLATIGIIHNFGQTPHQVFQRTHAPREELHHRFKRLDTAAESLTKLPFPLLESGERVSSLLFASKQDKLLCSAAFRLNIPPSYDKYMEWGFADNSIRIYLSESRKLVGLFEHMHQGQLSSALFADSRTLITAGVDCVVSVWTVTAPTSRSVDLQLKASLFGHDAPVTTLAISRSFSAFLTADSDGRVLLWDLNRLDFVRELAPGPSVECARINDITGNILLCRGARVELFGLNGNLLIDQQVGDDTDDVIFSCAFYEGVANEWLERDILFTGHRYGVVNVWAKIIRGGKFALELIKRLNHVDQSRESGSNMLAAITHILPMAQVVYTGDEDGKVYEWDCVQRHDDASRR
ncbi:MAG: hypothetical protein M1825_002052 [Sarcosagium campestre]|nr:MAG: hypothetical protein M1825_002052 [Sarcosagium campestre]